jgi:hypothetical protein
VPVATEGLGAPEMLAACDVEKTSGDGKELKTRSCLRGGGGSF